MRSKSIEIVRSIVVGTGTVEIGVSAEGGIIGEEVARPRTHIKPDKDAHHFYKWISPVSKSEPDLRFHGTQIILGRIVPPLFRVVRFVQSAGFLFAGEDRATAAEKSPRSIDGQHS